jgi:hypothetical protein
MKKRNIIAVACSAILLSACDLSLNFTRISSVFPFYTDQDKVFEPQLVGTWRYKDQTNNLENWIFEQTTNKGYHLTIVEDGKSAKFDAHLFRLGQSQYLDLSPMECKFDPKQSDLVAQFLIPGHLAFQVEQIAPNLKLAVINFDWLESFVTNNPAILAHQKESDRLILIADTPALQKFLVEHSNTNELFSDFSTFIHSTGKNATAPE